MTNTMTINEMDYRALQQAAKEAGIKANQSAETLRALLLAQVEVVATTHEDDEYEAFLNGTAEVVADEPTVAVEDGHEDHDDFFIEVGNEDSASEASAPILSEPTPIQASEASTPTYDKLFEFVRADNCTVEFRSAGKRVIIGWSKKDFKCYLYHETNGARFYSIGTAIEMFKRYQNNVHGDVAQIVSALVRLRNKPSIIKAKEEYAKAQQRAALGKENQSTSKPRRNSFVAIDPEWLKDYKATMNSNYDARNVRRDYEAYLNEDNVHSGSDVR